MSLVINHNSTADRIANQLSSHYSKLEKSTQRLSSGLRVNSAADDAAGLAIRELMRADIAALHQGIRNTNDAISMLQTADGALGVIDEKLIRMKELAEQAATGTYDSTQRAMIDSEFQMMASEIDRIAKATDFNGIKLLDGEFERTPTTSSSSSSGSTTSTSGTGSASTTPSTPTYSGTVTSASFNGPTGTYDGTITFDDTTGVRNNTTLTIKDNHILTATSSNGGTVEVTITGNDSDLAALPSNLDLRLIAVAGSQYFWMEVNGAVSFDSLNSTDSSAFTNQTGIIFKFNRSIDTGETISISNVNSIPDKNDFSYTISGSYPGASVTATKNGNQLDLDVSLDGTHNFTQTIDFGGDFDATALKSMSFKFTVTTPPGPTPPTPEPEPESEPVPDDVVKIHFGPGNDSSEDYYYIDKSNATLSGLGLNGVTIETQEKAQKALKTIDDAITRKDEIRAYYGAMQNRLENTMTTLSVQSENLQSAESRISDADVASEMMTFVRNQILTQSAVAMLAQANTMPQLAMRLIG